MMPIERMLFFQLMSRRYEDSSYTFRTHLRSIGGAFEE